MIKNNLDKLRLYQGLTDNEDAIELAEVELIAESILAPSQAKKSQDDC